MAVKAINKYQLVVRPISIIDFVDDLHDIALNISNRTKHEKVIVVSLAVTMPSIISDLEK